MNKNWKSLLVDLARLIGKGLRFFISRIVPATWRWLRDRVFPVVHRLYLQLPHRNLVTTVVVVAAIGLVLLWRRDTGAPGSVAFDSTAPIEVSRREARWVDQLLSDNWEAQKDATRGVLEAVGAKLVPDNVLVPDGDGLFVTSPELLMLAMDGARKGTISRLSLAELAFMLQDLGFPFPDDQVSSIVLEKGVRDWVQRSLEDPTLSGASAARFLHAMAARQTPPIDLASADWTAEQHGLTHLELFAFFAAFADGAPGVAQQVAGVQGLALPGIDLFAASFGRLVDAAVPMAHAASSRSSECSPLSDYYERMGKKLDFEQNAKTMEGAFGSLMKVAENAGKAGVAVAKAVEAINYAFKIQKLTLLYSAIDMELTADQGFVHKPHPGEADKEVVFNVTVGLDEQKYREFVERLNASESGKALRDCLASVGLPTPADMADIVGEMQNWEVEWRLDGGNGIMTMFKTGHASWSREKNGFEGPNHSREKLSPIDATHVGEDFIVDIARETLEQGKMASAVITGQALLRTDVTLPGTEVAGSLESAWKTLMDGNLLGGVGIAGTVIGSIGTTLTEVASGWARRIWDPKAYYNVSVAYHQEDIPNYTYEGTVKAEFTYNRMSSTKSRRNDDYTNYDVLTQGQGTLTARVRTDRMIPYVRNEGTDIWQLEGDGMVSGSYRYHSHKDALVSCAGAMLHQRKETRTDQGAGSNSSAGVYSMRIEQSGDARRENDLRIRLVFDAANVDIPYTQRYVDTGQAGCEFSSRDGWNRTNSEERTTGVGTTYGSFSHVIPIDELYPQTISGQQTVTDGPHTSGDNVTTRREVNTTTWTWNLRRVDPVE